jgi:hypothetical protein
MIMKKILYITLSIALFCVSCDKMLDKAPLDQISQASFWNTADDLILGVNNLYAGMNHAWDIDNESLDCYGKGPNAISSGTSVPGNTDGVWTASYTYIQRANEFLENYQKAHVPDSVKNRYAAEARFFRAYYYFNLLKRFGDVPLLMHTLDLNSPELYGPRTSRAVVSDSIIADLQWAAAYLPPKSELKASETGRITKGADLAFLSRVALYEGTWNKYHNGGDADGLLTISRDAALKVMQNNQYSLYPDFLTLFYEAQEDNQEVILSYRYDESVSGSDYNSRIRSVLLDNGLDPTRALADAFRCEDGLPVSLSPDFKGYGTLESEFENRDPRMAMTIWEPGTDYNGSPFKPDLATTHTGYWSKKYADPVGFVEAYVFTDEILIRYAEVLLNYAEATYELNGSISDADLDASINKLRDRVNMPHLTNAFVQGTNAAGAQLNMLDEIRNERRVELAEEGFRYDDLIRWGTAAAELPQQVLGATFHAANYPNIKPGVDVKLTADSIIIVQSAASRSFVSPRDYLFPIPLREISLNPKLEQNPGWD